MDCYTTQPPGTLLESRTGPLRPSAVLFYSNCIWLSFSHHVTCGLPRHDRGVPCVSFPLFFKSLKRRSTRMCPSPVPSPISPAVWPGFLATYHKHCFIMVMRSPLWVISSPAICEVMGSLGREMGDGSILFIIFDLPIYWQQFGLRGCLVHCALYFLAGLFAPPVFASPRFGAVRM